MVSTGAGAPRARTSARAVQGGDAADVIDGAWYSASGEGEHSVCPYAPTLTRPFHSIHASPQPPHTHPHRPLTARNPPLCRLLCFTFLHRLQQLASSGGTPLMEERHAEVGCTLVPGYVAFTLPLLITYPSVARTHDQPDLEAVTTKVTRIIYSLQSHCQPPFPSSVDVIYEATNQSTSADLRTPSGMAYEEGVVVVVNAVDGLTSLHSRRVEGHTLSATRDIHHLEGLGRRREGSLVCGPFKGSGIWVGCADL
ncbi:hypothetical protein B0H16DRAFT_1879722 [Mycena metata]|uniref:Uncharacterized protein n=1 Tax=Mycena metata TaxID=1033252 RepID=A0AAD7NV66_9AGAR|nr:hypothetical protein B0H16DRAFT_1879722 [Mycena metata]